MWSNHAVELFREYMGTGLIIIWFLIALIYLFQRENRRQIRILFVYVPLLLLIVFFHPGFSYLMTVYVGDEIYYRILWLLPVTVVNAYAGVTLCEKMRGKKKVCMTVLTIFIIAVSGNCIYANRYMSRAENWYHVPDAVVHICDAIAVEGREVTAAFPLSMVQYVRQYSPVVCMPYGREILVEGWNEWETHNALCSAVEASEVDALTLGTLAREENCIYFVVPEEQVIRGNLEEQGYILFDRIDGYDIYVDMFFESGKTTED